jgi:predicted solute-binding protein
MSDINNQSIDVTKIDWNNLTEADFAGISELLDNNKKKLKPEKVEKNKIEKRDIFVYYNNKTYFLSISEKRQFDEIKENSKKEEFLKPFLKTINVTVL